MKLTCTGTATVVFMVLQLWIDLKATGGRKNLEARVLRKEEVGRKAILTFRQQPLITLGASGQVTNCLYY